MPLPPRNRSRRWASLAVSAGLLGAGLWVGLPAGAGHVHWREARAALGREDFEAARARLALATRARPGRAAYAFEAARLARREHDFRAAEELLERARSLGHPADDLRLEEQLLAAQRSGWRRNDGPLLDALRRRPGDEPRIREVLAQAYFKDYLLLAALEQAEAWTRAEPGSGRAWQLVGDVRLRLGNKGAAGEAYKNALDRNPGLVRARVGYATILNRTNRSAEALEHFDLALAAGPADREARAGRVRALIDLDRLDEAHQAVTSLVATYPRDREVAGLAGRVALRMGRPAEAEAHLRLAASGPADWGVWHDLQQALVRQRKTAEATALQGRIDALREDFRRLDEVAQQAASSPDPAPRVEAGQIMIRNGLRREGAAWLHDALRYSPHYPPAHAALADHYAAVGDPDAARRHRQLAGRP